MSARRPYLPLYARDWLADTEVTIMGAVARAGYLDLLCRCWLDGSIPAHEDTPDGWARLATLARLTVPEMKKVWPTIRPHFVEHGGRLRNQRLERHREELERHAEQRSEAGRTAANARWKGGENRNAIA